MTLLRFAWDNLFQITLLASPIATILMLAFWSQVPSRKEFKEAKDQLGQRIKVMKSNQASTEARVSRVEQLTASLATKEDVQEVLLALAKQDGQRSALEVKIDGVAQRVAGMERPLDIIQEHLLRESRR